MNVGSVGSNQVTQQAHSAQAQVAKRGSSSEAREVGPDVDGDGDDAGAKAVKATAQQPAAATVNASGQKVGSIVNVTA